MKHYCHPAAIKVLLATALLLSGCSRTEPVTAESAGLSTQRLERIDKFLQQHVDEKAVAGASALIAHKGKIAYFKTNYVVFIVPRTGS